MAPFSNRGRIGVRPGTGRIPQPTGGGRIQPPLRYPHPNPLPGGGPGGGGRVPPPGRYPGPMPPRPGQAPSAGRRKKILGALNDMNPNQRKETIARAMYRRKMALNAGFKPSGNNG